MWNEQKRVLDSQLASGEVLLWSGQPRQGLFLKSTDALAIPFSLMWGGFAIFWNFGVWSSGAPVFFRLWGIPFLVIGLYMIVGRFFVDARQRSKTFYGVTNERIIIVSGVFSTSIKSLSLRTLTDVSVIESRDLSGTITFGPASQATWWSGLPFQTGRNGPVYPVFDSITGAKRVYEIIENAQRAAV
jgi:hypothetical protein